MDNKRLVLISVGIVVIVVGVVLAFSVKKKTASVTTQVPIEEAISIMKPEEIGLSLTVSADNKKVFLEITDTTNITGLDYELSYTSSGDIPRGVIGHIDVKQAGKAVKQEIVLGTCSDVCHYDEDVSNIKLILKVTKTDGSTSQVEESLELE